MKDKIHPVAKNPMRVDMSEGIDGAPDIIPSLEVKIDEAIPNSIRRKIYEYQRKYRNKPTHIILLLEEYLSLYSTLMSTRRHNSSLREPLTFEGVPCVPVFNGLGVDLDNLTQIAWENINGKTKL